ncbi:hypothetical protein B0H19DRAFT_1084346 [Mycena capillaripes]|nr:hypothetical protein B0H19DRAFT_1084346 [Mycena capillaripes]
MPFEALDQLYRQILLTVPDKYCSRLCDILSVIVNYPLGSLTVTEIDDLLGYEPGSVSLILRPLHSVLKFHSEATGIQMRHASFPCSILKALAYTYEDRQKNRADLEFRWRLGDQGKWIEYVTAQTPSMQFVPLVRLVNPDFVFYGPVLGDICGFLFWLEKIYPAPKDLIQRWMDYHVIWLYGDVQQLLEERDIQSPQRTEVKVLATSLHSLSALQAWMNSRAFLNAFRVFLSQSPRLKSDAFWLVAGPAFLQDLDVLHPKAMISRDLAFGFIQLIQRIEHGDLPAKYWKIMRRYNGHSQEWGHYIRSSPRSDLELLQNIDQFHPPWDIFSERQLDVKVGPGATTRTSSLKHQIFMAWWALRGKEVHAFTLSKA